MVNDGNVLDRECAVFCRHLIGAEPNDYVKKKYREAHQAHSWSRLDDSNPAEGFLVRVAAINPLITKVVDAYASVFRRTSLVRRKLVLLLAILESSAPTHVHLDSVDAFSVPVLFLRSLQRCLSFVVVMVVALLLISPLEWEARGSAKFVARRLPRHG